MGIKHEFRCLAHGKVFDAELPICPHGCTTVEKVFITPRGISTGAGTRIDNTFRTLAGDFNLSDMNTSPSRGNGSARVLTSQQKAALDFQEKTRTRFAPMKKNIGDMLAEHRMQGDNVLAEVKPALPSLARQVIGTRDPDKESRTKVMSS